MKLVVCGFVFWGLTRILTCQETTDSGALATERNATSSRAAVARRITFEKRWKSLKDLYTQAGFEEEQIARLKDMDLAVLEDLDKGRRPDFKALQTKRRQIVSEADETKLETARQAQLKQRKVTDENKTETSQTAVQE